MKRPLALLILAVALCASGATAYALTASAPAKARKTVGLRKTTLGRILVDSRGRTLYMFMKDARRKSRCSAACASAWPPLRTNASPRAGAGLKAARLGSIRRSDGARQVTYFGHPLYHFIGDSGPGDTNGQGLKEFGARWFAVRASGTRAGAQPKPQATPPPYPTGY